MYSETMEWKEIIDTDPSVDACKCLGPATFAMTSSGTPFLLVWRVEIESLFLLLHESGVRND
jgi:hypothetical protein